MDITELAPSTGTSEVAPSLAPETPAVAPATPEDGRAPATTDGELATSTETPTAPAAPKRRLADLVAEDPDLRRQLDGTVGERIRRDREERARAEAAARAEAQAQWEQNQLTAELQLRAAEDTRIKDLTRNDPNFELEGYVKSVVDRRDGVDKQWEAAAAQRQQAFQQYERDRAVAKAQFDAWYAHEVESFKEYPREVQLRMSQRPYDFGEDYAAAQAAYSRDLRTELTAYYQRSRDEDVRAGLAKELAKYNMTLPEVDLGRGMPVGGTAFTSREDAEAAFVSGKIDNAEMRRLIASGLSYRT